MAARQSVPDDPSSSGNVDASRSCDQDVSCVCTYLECGRRFMSMKMLEEHVKTFHNMSWKGYMEYYHRWTKPSTVSTEKDRDVVNQVAVANPADDSVVVPGSGMISYRKPTPPPAGGGVPVKSAGEAIRTFKPPSTDMTPDIVGTPDDYPPRAARNRSISFGAHMVAKAPVVAPSGQKAALVKRTAWNMEHSNYQHQGTHIM